VRREYPEEAIAFSGKGRREVRLLIERGRYARYTYLDPATGRPVKAGKEAVWLKPDGKGAYEELYIVPIGAGRNFCFRKKGTPGKAWDPRRKKAVGLF
jgi:hypothetical protein